MVLSLIPSVVKLDAVLLTARRHYSFFEVMLFKCLAAEMGLTTKSIKLIYLTISTDKKAFEINNNHVISFQTQ